MEPRKINSEKGDALLASGVTDTSKIPFCVSNAMEQTDGGLISFDNANTTGDFRTEGFLTLDECLLWLENEGLEASEIDCFGK